MKIIIYKTLSFLLFSAVFYIVILFFWGRYAPYIFKPNLYYPIGSHGHMYSRISEIKEYGDVDILFLGSSHAYRGFDTRIFAKHGYKTFNLGSSSQSPIQTKILLNRHLDALNPKIVIYEVYPLTLTSDGVESSLDIIANDINDFNSLKMALQINNIKTYNNYIYSLYLDILNLNDSIIEPVIKKDDRYISGGFVEKEIGFFKPTTFEKKEIAFNNYQLEYFTEIVQLFKNKNIELILVYAPIPKTNYDSYINNNYFDSLMSQHAKYYNFNKIISLNDSTHFQDSHHLNINGVKLFNKKLIEVVLNKSIKHHHNLDQYSHPQTPHKENSRILSAK